MSNVPCANYKRTFYSDKNAYELLMVSRKVDFMQPNVKSRLIVKTVKLWLYIAKAIELGKRELPEEIALKSVEDAIEDELKTELEQFSEPRFTVFDWNHKIELTLHSNSLPQPTLDEWWAMEDAQKELETLYPTAPQQKVAETRQDAPPVGFNILSGDKPATVKNAPVEGAIIATRAPSKNRQYADGQILQFSINKIVKGTNKGSVIYNLWGDLGKNYALKTIYMTKSGSDEKSQDFIATRDVLEGLNLSVDAGKIEAHGDWKLVTKVAHGKNGKGEDVEFFNAVSLSNVL